MQQQAALQPKERKGLREDTRGADAAQRVLVVLRAEAPGAAGRSTCRIASADIAKERGRAKSGPLTLSRHRRLTRALIDLES